MSVTKKEVKKVRPYFEVKVVKAKKEKDKTCFHWSMSRPYVCAICGKTVKSIESTRKKGNWVNGENLDKIKFPCFGWYQSGTGKRYCELDFINYEKGFYRIKELKQNKEKDYNVAEFWNPDLKSLIESLDFHILKGKIIIFEEEK